MEFYLSSSLLWSFSLFPGKMGSGVGMSFSKSPALLPRVAIPCLHVPMTAAVDHFSVLGGRIPATY